MKSIDNEAFEIYMLKTFYTAILSFWEQEFKGWFYSHYISKV